MSEPLTERAPEGGPPRRWSEPVDPVGEVARRNVLAAVLLVVLFLLIFGATFVIALVYLHYD